MSAAPRYHYQVWKWGEDLEQKDLPSYEEDVWDLFYLFGEKPLEEETPEEKWN